MRWLVVALLVSTSACQLYFDGPGDPDDPPHDADDEVTPLDPPLPPALTAGFTLTELGAIGSPVPDPTGIAFDGEQFWLISGGHNAWTHRLVRYDVDTFTITRDLTFTNLIEQLGTGVYGITWARGHIWIAVSGNTNKLVAVHPVTGAITRTWASPTKLGPTTLAWNGSRMAIANGDGDIYIMNIETGELDTMWSIDEFSGGGREHGIAALTGQFLANALFGDGTR